MTATLLHPDGRPLTVDELAQLNEAATSHQNFRKKLWCEVAVAAAAIPAPLDAILDCSDKVLAAFDKRFGK